MLQGTREGGRERGCWYHCTTHALQVKLVTLRKLLMHSQLSLAVKRKETKEEEEEEEEEEEDKEKKRRRRTQTRTVIRRR
ncbi:hypothetical protein E2C01_078328 [Portunus trituberculatus]|uniref:Uncharacterized protein n=1 Tax=Portunus trituberculatus TaxID=210409 RepID=A0A5B7ITV6_PORTR|nr:hypothetical protein [Portunus trituberculatus]